MRALAKPLILSLTKDELANGQNLLREENAGPVSR